MSSNKPKPIRCIETGTIYKSLTVAAKAIGIKSGSHLSRAKANGWACRGMHFEDASLPSDTHLCPDCMVPIGDCGWWHGLRPPEGAKTAIRQIREYAKGKGRKRILIDRVIVVECPNFRRYQKCKRR